MAAQCARWRVSLTVRGGGSLNASPFLANTDFILLAGVNTGNGLVTIDLISATPPTNVPKPVSLSVLGAGLLGLGLIRGRRKNP